MNHGPRHRPRRPLGWMPARAIAPALAAAAWALIFLAGPVGCVAPGELALTPSPRVDQPNPGDVPARRFAGFFIAEAVLPGRGTLALLVDTGSEDTLLDSAVARRLLGDRLTQTAARARTASGMIVDLGGAVRIDELRVGPLVARDFAASTLDLGPISGALGTRIDGLLGWNVLRAAPITFDYRAGRIIVHDPLDPPPMPAADRLLRGPVPIARIRLAERSVRVVVDTGSDGTIALAGFEGLPLRSPARDAGIIYDVAGRIRAQSAVFDGVAHVAGAEIDRPVLETTPGLPRIGSGAFEGRRLTLDAQRGLVLLE